MCALLLGKDKIISFKNFYMIGLFVFDKIDWLSLIVFIFTIDYFVVGLNLFGLVYFFLDFRSSFFMAFKRRKMLELQTFFFKKLLMWWVVIGKLKSDVSSGPRCEPIKIYYLSNL